jgi:hypothetical protein
MGFYSYTCAKTGLPVMAGSAASQKDVHLCEVVVLYPNGDRYTGVYDGYGNVGNMEVADDMMAGRAKMVLKYFDDGKTFDKIEGKSSSDPRQGFTHDWEFVSRAFSVVNMAMKYPDDIAASALERTQFALRDGEFYRICDAIGDHLDTWMGVKIHQIAEIHEQMIRDLESHWDDARWLQQWDEKIAPQIQGLHATSIIKTMEPAAVLVTFDAIQNMLLMAARNEVMQAWQEGRASRTPDVRALMKNPSDPLAWGLPIMETMPVRGMGLS